MWRYTSTSDLTNILKAASLGSLLVICYVLFRYRFIGFPRSVFFLDWFLIIFFIAAHRIMIRLYFEHESKSKSILELKTKNKPDLQRRKSDIKNLLIIGAGDCGEKMYREIRDNSQLRYNVVGFLDDNPSKIRKTIHGLPVMGIISDLQTIAKRVKAEELLIAIPSASYQEMRRIVALCRDSGSVSKRSPAWGN